MFIVVVLFYDDYIQISKVHSKLVMRYFQHDKWNLNRVWNWCAMVAKPVTITLIIKMASEVGPLLLCCCRKFLTSNDFGGRLSAKQASLTVGYPRTRTRIYKSTVYHRERAGGKMSGGPQVYKYPLAVHKGRFCKMSLKWKQILQKSNQKFGIKES